MLADVRSTGATFRPWIEAPNRAEPPSRRRPVPRLGVQEPVRSVRPAARAPVRRAAPGYAADVTAAINDVGPDLVVCSFFAFGAMAAAEAAGVAIRRAVPERLPAAGLGHPTVRARAGAGQECTGPGQGPRHHVDDHAAVGQGLARFQRAAGLARAGSDRLVLRTGPPSSSRAGAHLVRLRLPRRPAARTSATSARSSTIPSGRTPWRGRRPPTIGPLVLVALSTTFQDHAACLQRIVDALATLPVHAIVTTGPAIDPSTITAAANVTVVAAAPHSQILRRAAAVVTHGGHGTVVRALAAGVPMVVLPHGRDQADNARRITSRGAGIALRRSAKPTKIATAVERLLDNPAYRVAAERLGETIRRDASERRPHRRARELRNGSNCALPGPGGNESHQVSHSDGSTVTFEGTVLAWTNPRTSPAPA